MQLQQSFSQGAAVQRFAAAGHLVFENFDASTDRQENRNTRGKRSFLM